jgi:membrane associated rhomboid family serine protease
MFNITPLVRNILIVNVVVFVLQQILKGALIVKNINGQEVGLGLTQIISLWDIRTPLFAPYQFFTYMFAHGSIGHIFFNMMALASFAPILENYWGDKKFLFFYLATGIGAGVIYAVVNFFLQAGGGSMLGASGALYGVLMAFGMVFPNMEVRMLFVPVPIRAKYLVFIIGFLTYFFERASGGGNVAHLAHFGGAVVGFLLVSIWGGQQKRGGW